MTHERAQHAAASPAHAVEIPCGTTTLQGDLVVPSKPCGIVIFAHGSGSGRHSPRNRFVAEVLQRAGLATLLLDLLSRAEEKREAAGAMRRFDVEMLADRLLAATEWVRRSASTRALPAGYFGASTGAAAALAAAARQQAAIFAVVSRGGRPDLASSDLLARVTAPTLLIVGAADTEVLALNRRASAQLRCEHDLLIIPGATHLFEEPGTLEAVAERARDWFRAHLQPGSAVGVTSPARAP